MESTEEARVRRCLVGCGEGDSKVSSTLPGLISKEGDAMFVLLSYPLREDSPTFLDNPSVRIRDHMRINRGDGCNQYIIETLNHSGTHLDTPNHVGDGLLRLEEIPIGELYFTAPLLLDIPKDDGQLIEADNLWPHRQVIQGHNLLLLRTGFWRYRSTDPERYRWHNPGVGPSAARFLLQECSTLRAIGVDLISVASAQHIEEGALAHYILLGHREGERHLLVVEDMALGAVTSPLKSVWVVPWMLEGVDSAPVTVMGELEP